MARRGTGADQQSLPPIGPAPYARSKKPPPTLCDALKQSGQKRQGEEGTGPGGTLDGSEESALGKAGESLQQGEGKAQRLETVKMVRPTVF